MGGFFRNPAKATKSFFGVKSPPAIDNNAPNPIANQLPPVNFVSIFDEISGNNFSIIRGADNRIDLKMGGKSRISLDAPIDIDRVNTNLPMVRKIKGRELPEIEQAANVSVLTSALRQLGDTIGEMQRTSPNLIPQFQDLITSYDAAQNRALEKGFNIREAGLDYKLAKLGLSNSSTALGAQIALAREKADATLKANLDRNIYFQGLKSETIQSMIQQGGLMATNAEIELNRFNSESANKLQLRGQDMEADLNTQRLEQQQAFAQSQLQLSANDQKISAELGRRDLAAQQQANLLETGFKVFSSGNDQAIGARSSDNMAIAQNNQLKQQRFLNTSENPWKLMAQKMIAQTAGQIIGGPIGAHTAGQNMESAQKISRRR